MGSAPAAVVGRIVSLFRYPVKSMAAEALPSAPVSWHGIAGDRRWALVRPDRPASGFPWLTIRERPELWSYRPTLENQQRPDGSAVHVRTPEGDVLNLQDPGLLARFGAGVRLMKIDRGVFDVLPLSIITTQAVQSLSQSVGSELDVRRFRPNILIEATGSESYPEDGWVGSVLRMGGAAVRVDQRDQRCVLVNVDPTDQGRSPEVLRTIVTERDNCLGVYGSTVQPGRVAVGDLVTIDGTGPEG